MLTLLESSQELKHPPLTKLWTMLYMYIMCLNAAACSDEFTSSYINENHIL